MLPVNTWLCHFLHEVTAVGSTNGPSLAGGHPHQNGRVSGDTFCPIERLIYIM